MTIGEHSTHGEIMAHALALHPDCSYAEWDNGMTFTFQFTRVVKLWRNGECYLAGDSPRYVVDGYPAYRPQSLAQGGGPAVAAGEKP
jgi:hypothetical protein